MAVSGNAVLLYANTGTISVPVWTAVGSQRGLQIKKTADVLDASHKNNSHQEVVQGRKASTITLDSLYVDGDTAFAAIKSAYDTGATVLVRKYVSGVATEQAECIINDVSEDFPDNEISTRSIGLTVNGAWTPV